MMKKLITTLMIGTIFFSLSFASVSANSITKGKSLDLDTASEEEVEDYVSQTISTMKETETNDKRIITFTEPNGDSTKVIFDKETDQVSFDSEAFDSETAKEMEKMVNKAHSNQVIEHGNILTSPDGIPDTHNYFATINGSIAIGNTWTVAAVTGVITSYLGGGPVIGGLTSIVTKIITDSLPTIYTAEHVYLGYNDSYKHVFFFTNTPRNSNNQINSNGLVFYYPTLIGA